MRFPNLLLYGEINRYRTHQFHFLYSKRVYRFFVIIAFYAVQSDIILYLLYTCFLFN